MGQLSSGFIPKFTHVDKDMVEIGMLRTLWNLKIQLCWWHMQKVVRERLSKGKLATMPYNVSRAQAEFAFISLTFVPYGKPDTTEYEGGNLEDPKTDEAPKPNPNSIAIQIPALSSLREPSSSAPPALPSHTTRVSSNNAALAALATTNAKPAMLFAKKENKLLESDDEEADDEKTG